MTQNEKIIAMVFELANEANHICALKYGRMGGKEVWRKHMKIDRLRNSIVEYLKERTE